MKYFLSKIVLSTAFLFFIASCSVVKKVPESRHLLTSNQIFIDSIKSNDPNLKNLLSQNPNSRVLGISFPLQIYNLASANKDSSYQDWLNKKPNRKKRLSRLLSEKQVHRLGAGLAGINNWLQTTGEPPVILDNNKTKRSVNRLLAYYWNNGWFNVKGDYKITKKENQKALVDYYIEPKKPYFLDGVRAKIQSKDADSIYQIHKQSSALIAGSQYKTLDIEKERERLTQLYRNSGLFHFEKEYINFDADTVNTDQKVLLNLLIKNRQITEGDSTAQAPFKVHKISKVNIFTDYSFKNRDKTPKDSTLYNGYSIYSFDKLRYSRKALTNSVLITPGEIFKDKDRTLTYNQINNLKAFKYPNIRYDLDPNDPEERSLIANVLLTPRKKYSTNLEFDVSTSNIQAFGIGFGGSFLIRNIFRGAELLEISARGSVGSSQNAVADGGRFFNISEIGTDIKLTFPKIIFPLNTNRIVPKTMSPKTNLIFGYSTQQNIGLDKSNFSGIFNYNWSPRKAITHQIDLINIQYVINNNPENYFNIYQNSYRTLNLIARDVLDNTSPFFANPAPDTPINEARLNIPDGANGFISESLSANPNTNLDLLQIRTISNINERKERLTENNLIFASNYSFTRNTKENIYDDTFSRFNAKIEFAGNVLNGLARVVNFSKTENDRFEILDVEYSQYAKTELDYIKHWGLGRKSIIALRASGGIAIPYGNATSIPFSKSFFAGGPNDNRAWLAYELGPGSSGGKDQFNEANLKLAMNLEYRFKILGAVNGALFVDAGNIWNVLDSEEQETAVFSGIKDLKEIAFGSGMGIRYDFDFFIFRLDVGFKTFNPAINEDSRWFKGYNFSRAVYNVGINYPF